MAKQTINLGTQPSGADGDTSRTAFEKSKANFEELYVRAQSRLAKSIAGGAGVVTLTAVEALAGIIDLTGAISGNREVIVSADPQQVWVVRNSTTGSGTVTVRTPSGRGVAIAAGASDVLYSDGTNVESALAAPIAVAQSAAAQATVAANGGQRNLLLNPLFAVNQRGYTSGAATTTANQYVYDRWRVVTSGQNAALSGTTLTVPAGGLEQVVEGANIGGGAYTLSWSGTATATVNGAAVAKGAAVTLAAGANAAVRFIGGSLSQPQLERGSAQTAFDQRPLSLELMLCQRYYERGVGIFCGQITNGAAYYAGVGYKATKRVVATMTFSNIENPGFTGATGISGTNTVDGFVAKNLATTSGDAGYYVFNWTANAEL